MESKQNDYDGGLFHTKKVVNFLANIDDHCIFLASILTKFKNHAKPIFPTSFELLVTQTEDTQCSTFRISFLTSVMDSITIDIRRDVLENSTKETPITSTDDILARLTEVYNESIPSDEPNPTVDNKLDAANIDWIDNDHDITNQEKDAHTPRLREKKYRGKHASIDEKESLEQLSY